MSSVHPGKKGCMRWLQAAVSETSFLVPKYRPNTKDRLTIWASPVGDAKMLKGQKHIVWGDIEGFGLVQSGNKKMKREVCWLLLLEVECKDLRARGAQQRSRGHGTSCSKGGAHWVYRNKLSQWQQSSAETRTLTYGRISVLWHLDNSAKWSLKQPWSLPRFEQVGQKKSKFSPKFCDFKKKNRSCGDWEVAAMSLLAGFCLLILENGIAGRRFLSTQRCEPTHLPTFRHNCACSHLRVSQLLSGWPLNKWAGPAREPVLMSTAKLWPLELVAAVQSVHGWCPGSACAPHSCCGGWYGYPSLQDQIHVQLVKIWAGKDWIDVMSVPTICLTCTSGMAPVLFPG